MARTIKKCQRATQLVSPERHQSVQRQLHRPAGTCCGLTWWSNNSSPTHPSSPRSSSTVQFGAHKQVRRTDERLHAGYLFQKTHQVACGVWAPEYPRQERKECKVNFGLGQNFWAFWIIGWHTVYFSSNHKCFPLYSSISAFWLKNSSNLLESGTFLKLPFYKLEMGNIANILSHRFFSVKSKSQFVTLIFLLLSLLFCKPLCDQTICKQSPKRTNILVFWLTCATQNGSWTNKFLKTWTCPIDNTVLSPLCFERLSNAF